MDYLKTRVSMKSSRCPSTVFNNCSISEYEARNKCVMISCREQWFDFLPMKEEMIDVAKIKRLR